MPVTTIYLLRHALRLAYTLDPFTGTYSSAFPFPTSLPGDPPLSARGADQTHELAKHLTSVLGPIVEADQLRVYSSCFYRCLETLKPWVESMKKEGEEGEGGFEVEVRGEPGIGEWFGYSSRFTHPRPLPTRELHDRFFPFVSTTYSATAPASTTDDSGTGTVVVDLSPNPHGENIAALHDRIARSITHIVQQVEAEYAAAGRAHEPITLLLCFHAAPLIAAGRVLTGSVPEDWTVDDFHCFTAGLSKFERKDLSPSTSSSSSSPPPPPQSNTSDPSSSPPPSWRHTGILNGWTCVSNSDTSFLSSGAERGWHFHGNEDFDNIVTSTSTSAAAAAAVADEQKQKPKGQGKDIYGFEDEVPQQKDEVVAVVGGGGEESSKL